MGAYLVRRLLQAIPTLLGVLLISFVLFQVVGGSPAALTLGDRAAPRELEDYDEVRGFNKPVLGGWWTSTRAFADLPGRQSLPAVGSLRMELRFPLRADAAFRWSLQVVNSSATSAVVRAACGTAHASVRVPPGDSRRLRLDVPASAAAGATALELAGGDGAVSVEAIRLRRRVASFFDSRLAHYVGRLLRGDLGWSYMENQRVADVLRAGIGPSLCLAAPILLVGLFTAIPLALICVSAHHRWPDRLLVLLTVGLMSINYVVWIVAGQYLLGFRLGWFPVWGFESWRYVVLPALVGVVSGLGADVRFYRTVFLEEIGQDYVRTAVAKGLSPRRVLFGHVLRNALLPVITSMITALPFLYTGSLLLEAFFGIPGLGYLGVNAINNNDGDVLQAVVLIGALLYLAANLLCDALYALADPRIQFR